MYHVAESEKINSKGALLTISTRIELPFRVGSLLERRQGFGEKHTIFDRIVSLKVFENTPLPLYVVGRRSVLLGSSYVETYAISWFIVLIVCHDNTHKLSQNTSIRKEKDGWPYGSARQKDLNRKNIQIIGSIFKHLHVTNCM